jgi:hypothetical protein
MRAVTVAVLDRLRDGINRKLGTTLTLAQGARSLSTAPL